MTEEQQAEHDSEYQSLLALYIALLKSWYNDEREEALYALSELRTDIAFKHVLKGLGVDYEFAMQLVQNTDEDTLSQYDKDMRDRIVAAIMNLIDFSVCEEYQLYDSTLEELEDLDWGEVDFDSPEYEELIALCQKYNDHYSAVENYDIEYAGAVASAWIRMAEQQVLVYWTQNDNKVRPWHLALQGYAATRDEFPEWMIPPIEYNCRCYLIASDMGYYVGNGKLRKIKGDAKNFDKPKQIDDVYSESLAKCGRIFGTSHNYFKVKHSDKIMLDGFVARLREKYHVGK